MNDPLSQLRKCMSHLAKDDVDNHSEIWELIRTLVLGQASPAHILELYYWSQDPALLDFVRAVVILPQEDRVRLFSFFSNAEPKSISVSQASVNRLAVEVRQP